VSLPDETASSMSTPAARNASMTSDSELSSTTYMHRSPRSIPCRMNGIEAAKRSSVLSYICAKWSLHAWPSSSSTGPRNSGLDCSASRPLSRLASCVVSGLGVVLLMGRESGRRTCTGGAVAAGNGPSFPLAGWLRGVLWLCDSGSVGVVTVARLLPPPTWVRYYWSECVCI